MNNSSAERFGEVFAHALREEARRRREEPLNLPPVAVIPALTVAISRECGAGGTEVARQVGSRLNWPVYDRVLLERVASDAGVRTELLESLDEKHQSAFAEWLYSLVAGARISASEFIGRLKTGSSPNMCTLPMSDTGDLLDSESATDYANQIYFKEFRREERRNATVSSDSTEL